MTAVINHSLLLSTVCAVVFQIADTIQQISRGHDWQTERPPRGNLERLRGSMAVMYFCALEDLYILACRLLSYMYFLHRCYHLPKLLPVHGRGPFEVAIATEHIRTPIAAIGAKEDEQRPLELMAQVRCCDDRCHLISPLFFFLEGGIYNTALVCVLTVIMWLCKPIVARWFSPKRKDYRTTSSV